MKKETSVRYHGIGIGGSGVCGPLRFFRRKKAEGYCQTGDVECAIEQKRLSDALIMARERIEALHMRAKREIGEAEAEIFEIHGMLLEDEDFVETVREEINSGRCAEIAVEAAAREYESRLRALGDEYLSARAADVKDVASHIIYVLAGEDENEDDEHTHPYILVADDLSPSETVTMEKSLILGFVTFGGTPNSHTSILARAMGIPALVGVGSISEDCDGAFALLDAADGTLNVSPSDEERRAFEEKIGEIKQLAKEHERYLRSLIHQTAVTRGGRRVLIYANVGDANEIPQALLNGADGVGLLRSEFLYLSLDRYPTEEELFTSYRAAAERMRDKRIVIRTLDIGADKQIPYFELPHEENPALGFRGVRICLARREVFHTQLRAILRASAYGKLSVMIPMIVSVNEVRACRAILTECMEELSRKGVPFDREIEFGIMIETPAAAIMSDEIAREVDFFSVGTNDLTQYTLATDRQNPLVARICEENNEPILRLIETAAQSIHRHGGWIGICGELAADLRLTQRFIDLEIDELSVSVPYLLGVREKVIECN